MQRKNFTGEIKAKVAIEALKGLKTANEIAGEYECHPTQVSQWKREFLDGASGIFENKKGRKAKGDVAEKEQLYAQIGELQVQLAWLKKNLLVFDKKLRLKLVDKSDQAEIPVKLQCQLLGLCRATVYYKPEPLSENDLLLMKLIDEQYTKTPFYGRRRMTAWLRKQVGFQVNGKRVSRLMKALGLEAIYPKPNTSRAHPKHEKYPYLLRGLEITRVNQVWSADITYVRLEHGFAYLIAVIDWHSRYVLSWRLSNTLDTDFCVEALEEALRLGKPEIFNTDQGCQFTSEAWIEVLKNQGIFISMDGRGRALDNIFVERLWRSVKYEDIYPKNYRTMTQAREGLFQYFRFYNMERLHQSLKYQTPWEVHHGLEGRVSEDQFTKTSGELDLMKNPVLLS